MDLLECYLIVSLYLPLYFWSYYCYYGVDGILVTLRIISSSTSKFLVYPYLYSETRMWLRGDSEVHVGPGSLQV